MCIGIGYFANGFAFSEALWHFCLGYDSGFSDGLVFGSVA